MPSQSVKPELLQRRSLLAASAMLGWPAWAGARGLGSADAQPADTKPAHTKSAKTAARRGKAMTAAEESVAAKAVADAIAEQTGEPAHPAVGTTLKLPATFKLFDGQDFSEAHAKGKLLVVFYWASWCPICKVVEPRLQDFWLKNRAKGIEVLALSTDTEVQPAFAHIQKTGWKFPVSMAKAARLDDIMTPRSLPTLFVRSRLGVIVNADEGEIDAEDFKDYLAHV